MRWFLSSLGFLLLAVFLFASNGGLDPKAAKPGSEAAQFAHQLLHVAHHVAEQYVRPVPLNDLLLAALAGLYESARVPLPASLAAAVRKATTDEERLTLLARARDGLKEGDPLRGPDALLAAFRGMCRVLDPYSKVVSGEDLRRARGIDQQHGIGVELVENNGVGPLVIKAVLPGSPAQKGGLRPSDEIAVVDGRSVQGQTAEQVQAIFSRDLLTVPVDLVSTGSGSSQPGLVELIIRRPGRKEPLTVAVERQSFRPETVLGVMRRDDNSWDYLLDRQHRLAHVRLETLGNGTADELGEVLAGLRSAGVRGLILDLRWCPGGYLKEAVGVASLFLRDGDVALIRSRTGEVRHVVGKPDERLQLLDVPVVVLVNGETAGGAELIAAALQDHKRAVVAGQRTLGKASVQTSLDLSVPGMGMKLTTGTFIRPGGQNLHRFPESKRTDAWGVRPEPELEMRVSPELARELREHWQQQTLRPGPSRERLPLDDPQADPQRQAALEALRGRVK
jgi:carboxyl-terminal processing protease